MNKQEIIKHIEIIEQKLTNLQLTMELLSAHAEVIQMFTTDDLNSLNLPTDVLCNHWDRVKDGCNLHRLAVAIANNTSEELSSICYEKISELKKVIKDVM